MLNSNGVNVSTGSAITRAQQNHVVLSSIMESKLTRTELMDFVIDRVRDEFQEEKEELEARLDELAKIQLKPKDALKLLKLGELRVTHKVETEWGRREGKSVNIPVAQLVKVSVKLPLRVKMPAYFTEARAEEKKLKKRKDAIEAQVNLITTNRKRARNQLVRTALESSPEGKNILAAVDALKESIVREAAEGVGTGAVH